MAKKQGSSTGKKILKPIKAVGTILAAPFMFCSLIYNCFIAETDPWGAPNHLGRERRKREKKERKARAREADPERT